MVFAGFAFFIHFWYTLIKSGGINMQQDNGKKIPVRDRLIEALETQIEKQKQIIET